MVLKVVGDAALHLAALLRVKLCVSTLTCVLCVHVVYSRMSGAPVTCPAGAKLRTTSLAAWRLYHQVGHAISRHAGE